MELLALIEFIFIWIFYNVLLVFPGGSVVRALAMQEPQKMQVQLGQEDLRRACGNLPSLLLLENSMDKVAWQAVVHRVYLAYMYINVYVYFITYFIVTEGLKEGIEMICIFKRSLNLL